MKIGLFFGTFNPIHLGHLLIAQTALNQAKMDKIWFVVSPSSPDKDYSKLLHEFDRFDLAFEATKDNPDFKVLDIEFQLPKPSFTYLTIKKLKELHPNIDFYILLGSDNFSNLSRWKNSEELQKNVRFIIYPRVEKDHSERRTDDLNHWISAPYLNISSTAIRKLIREGKSAKYLVPDDSLRIIKEKGFFS